MDGLNRTEFNLFAEMRGWLMGRGIGFFLFKGNTAVAQEGQGLVSVGDDVLYHGDYVIVTKGHYDRLVGAVVTKEAKENN